MQGGCPECGRFIPDPGALSSEVCTVNGSGEGLIILDMFRHTCLDEYHCVWVL
jgi:hypothetical protein